MEATPLKASVDWHAGKHLACTDGGATRHREHQYDQWLDSGREGLKHVLLEREDRAVASYSILPTASRQAATVSAL